MKPNRYIEAFKENHNIIGLASIVAASAAMLSPVPLLIGAVAEVAYLLFYADSRWYALRLAQRFDGEIEARRKELKQKILPLLDAPMQARFIKLESMRQDIGNQAQDDAQWYREVLRKLDFLLEKFLHFAAKEVQFRGYLQSVRDEVRAELATTADTSSGQRPRLSNIRGGTQPPGIRRNLPDTRAQQPLGRPMPGRATSAVDDTPKPILPFDAMNRWTNEVITEVQRFYDLEIQELQRCADEESDNITKAVLEKRLDVLQRRREYVGKIGRIQINLHHQLQLVEDTFGLINDEIRARPPEQVLSDIEDVVSQTNTMTQLLDEVAPLERLLAS